MSYPNQVTRYYCPLGACDWSHDDQGPAASTLGMAFTDGLEAAARSYFTGVEDVIRAHLESHPLEEWAREVTSLRAQVPVPPPDLTAVPWRQGRSHPANLWAATGEDWREHQPAGRMDSGELAAEACAAHNLALDLRWLLVAGFTVSVSRYLDSGPPAVLLHEVVLRDDEGGHVLTVDGQPTLGEALAEARKQAEGAAT